MAAIDEKEYTQSFDWKIWKRLGPFLRPYRGAFVSMLVFNGICALVDVVLPLFQKLHSDVAIGFNRGWREMLFPAKLPVVVQHAVVGEGERLCAAVPLERVVVAVPLFAALCREPGVPDDRSCPSGEEQLDLV